MLDALELLPRPDVDGVRWTTREQWHVTLRFLGELDAVEPVAAALSGLSVGRTSGRAPVRMGPVVRALGRHVLCLPVAGLDEVAAEVTASLDAPAGDRPFHGHLTLARGRRGVDLRPLAGAPAEATWDAAELCLVESRLHPQGARYEVLARFTLGR